MIYCQNCKHWNHHGHGATWGSCEHIKQSDLTDIYTDLSDTEISEHIDIGIVVDTLPDFGCVMGEE